MSLRDNLVQFGLNLPEDFGVQLESWAAKLGESPCRNTVTLVGLSTVAFYLLEKDRNPKVNDVWDSMVYCSTCLSVGYGDIFAKTPLGKILGSALMTIGPSMAARMTEGPDPGRRDDVQAQVLETLRQILAKLEQAPAPTGGL
jgi:hypothetical protein